ncbi:MAG: hypothetical protein GC154_03805 [bacterium]|nr:hypothetical protein [bacterium]
MSRTNARRFGPIRPPWMALAAACLCLAALAATDPKIGPRDVLSITVYNEPTLTMDVVVSASGRFSFPLLGRVDAEGKTADQLGLHMEERLKKERFLADPTVIVRIHEQNSAAATLSGAMEKPGVAPIFPGMRLRELISRNGGVKADEAGPFLNVQRASGEMFSIDREALMSAQGVDSATLNIEVMPGDEVIAPIAREVYVLGAVNKPGGVAMTRALTLDDAFGLAGGRSQTAGDAMLWNHTEKDGEPKLITFTYYQYQNDPALRGAEMTPGDSVYVPQNDFVFVGGEVERPGAIPWKPEMTLMSAIVEAGDKTFVAGNDVWLIRAGADGRQARVKYKLTALRKGGNPISVIPGDVIQVSPGILNIPYTLRRLNPFTLPVDIFGAPPL